MCGVARRDYGKYGGSGERRRGDRFPIRQPVQYKLIGPGAQSIGGTGTSLNFSKTGIEFTTEALLPVGGEIEFTVNWPAELNAQCALKFVGKGRVVRAATDRAAVKIYQYEFRTRCKQSDGPPALPPDVLNGGVARRLPPA
jgi:hypothetical protein